MSFRELLKYLVESVPGSIGAVFADWEGEAVDTFALDGDEDHARFYAAHQGILLEAVRRLAGTAEMGETKFFIIRSEKADYITAPVHDGYYIVLALNPDISGEGGNFPRARMAMEQAIRQLRYEMGY